MTAPFRTDECSVKKTGSYEQKIVDKGPWPENIFIFLEEKRLSNNYFVYF